MRNSWFVHHHQPGGGVMKRTHTAALAALCWAASGCAAGTTLPHRPQPSVVATQTQSIRAVPLDDFRAVPLHVNGVKRRSGGRIWDPGTLRPSGPVFVVDGRRLTADELMRLGLDPREFVEFYVLRGPAATALYGTSGAEGVVIITTRAGARP